MCGINSTWLEVQFQANALMGGKGEQCCRSHRSHELKNMHMTAFLFHLLQSGWKMSKNHLIQSLHVRNASDFVTSINARVLPGDSILMDFPYFLHPTAIGHWPEVLFPLFSALRARPDIQPKRALLMSLKRAHVNSWSRHFIATAMNDNSKLDIPLLFQKETDSVWHQICTWLMAYLLLFYCWNFVVLSYSEQAVVSLFV